MASSRRWRTAEIEALLPWFQYSLYSQIQFVWYPCPIRDQNPAALPFDEAEPLCNQCRREEGRSMPRTSEYDGAASVLAVGGPETYCILW